jgi:hypothetical protein
MGEKRNAYRLLVVKQEAKRPLGRPRRRWVDNMKMDLLDIGWGGVDWIAIAQDRDKWRALVNDQGGFLIRIRNVTQHATGCKHPRLSVRTHGPKNLLVITHAIWADFLLSG